MRIGGPLRFAILVVLAGCGAKGPFTFGWGSTGAPLAHDGLVALWTYNHQITQYSDSEVWAVHTWDTHANGVQVGLAQGEGLLYAGPSMLDDGSLLVPDDGVLRQYTASGVPWEDVEVDTEGRISTAPAIAVDGTAHVGTESGKVHAVRDGAVAWSADTPGTPFNRLAIGEDGAIFGFGAAVDEQSRTVWTAFALEADGTERWSKPIGTPYGSPALGRDGIVLVSQNSAAADVAVPDPSTWVMLALDPESGEPVWETSLGLPGSSPIVERDGTVIVALNSEVDQDGEVIYLSGKDGDIKHRTDRLGWTGQPTLGTDGRIYLGCGNEFCVLTGGGGVADRWQIREEEAWIDPTSVDLPPVLVDGRVMAVLHDNSVVYWDLGRDVDVEDGSWARNGGNAHGSGRVENP